MATFDDQVTEVVAADITLQFEKNRKRIHGMISDCGGAMVLFGSGELGRITLAGLRKIGMEPLAFADNNPGLWGREVNGVPVLSPEDAALRFAGKAVFVVTIYTSSSPRNQMIDLGVAPISFPELAWAYTTLLPHGAVDLPDTIIKNATEVLSAGRLWDDDISRNEYLGQLKWRTTLDLGTLPEHLPPGEIYSLDDMVDLRPDEDYVDCGAYDGDTINEFIKRNGGTFGSIMGIEPDPSNFERLMSYVSKLPEEQRMKVTGWNIAVGAHRETVKFNATGSAMSSLGKGGGTVQCFTLDELLEDSRPTYIKMDIEGAELDALRGATNTIRDHLPVLAICTYHLPTDMWRIPLAIKTMSDDYRFFLRRYSDECWETVCYAVPVGRCKK